MANIEDEEEDVVVVEIEPPKRKKIATLKVWSHCDWHFTIRSVRLGYTTISSRRTFNLMCLVEANKGLLSI